MLGRRGTWFYLYCGESTLTSWGRWTEERRSVCAFIHSLMVHPLILLFCTATVSQVPSVCDAERCPWGGEPS